MAPEWLPERSHDSGRQSNAAVDIRLKVARVGDDGTQVGDFVNKLDSIGMKERRKEWRREGRNGGKGKE